MDSLQNPRRSARKTMASSVVEPGPYRKSAYQIPINAASFICRRRRSSGEARRPEVAERYDVTRPVAEQLGKA